MRRPQVWIWGAVVLSILLCGVIALLHFEQRLALERSTSTLDALGQARLDLAQGLLHAVLSTQPGSPFDRELGLARLQQAVAAIESEARRLPLSDSAAFVGEAARFRERLTTWQSAPSPPAEAELRIAFHRLEQVADRIDGETRRSLADQVQLQDRAFGRALAAAALLLAGICTAVAVASRARQRSEAALRLSRARLQAALDGGGVGTWIWDLSAGRVWWDEAVTRMIGRRPEEFDGRLEGLLEAFQPEDRPVVRAAVTASEKEGQDLAVEFRAPRADGVVPWIACRGRLQRDESGGPRRMTGAISDISARKAAELALRESEARHRALVEQAPEAILLADPGTGAIVEHNPAAERLFGRDGAGFSGLALRDLCHGDQERELLDGALSGALAAAERTFRSADGADLLCEVRGLALQVSRRTLVRLSLTDVRDRRALQQQLLQAQKMEAVGRLAGGVAHDFNNALAVIIGHGELLLRKLPAEAPGRRHVEGILEASQRSAGLTRQLLAFSRKQVLQPRVLDPNELLLGLEQMLSRLIGEDVDLSLRLRARSWVRADPGQLEQAVMNLAVNARDALPQGGRIEIETDDVPGDGLPCVALRVRDDGAGMDEETRARAFEPFFTTKAVGKGTGLGLATVLGIVEQSGGRVQLESEPGQGTAVTLLLPAAPRPRAEAAAEPVEDPPAAPRAAGRREVVLVVEDEASARSLLAEVLGESGFDVLTAADGVEALEVGARAPVLDLLLTDVILPRLGGRQAAERLRAARPDLRVIYMSGYTDDALSVQGVLGPEVTLLEKPFSTETLVRRVREVLDGPPR